MLSLDPSPCLLLFPSCLAPSPPFAHKEVRTQRSESPLHPCPPGIVPALFPEEEKDGILSQIGQEALKCGMGPAKESVWQYFVNKSANNLHIVLGMSPVGDTLRTRCRNFPGILHPCGGIVCALGSWYIPAPIWM